MSTSLDALRFDVLVKGLDIDDARRAQRMAGTGPAGRCYVIMFSARSGSSWLTSILSATERMGFPQEYINPDLVREAAQKLGARTAVDFLGMLMRVKQSRNGVFGVKARAVDIDLLGEDAFLATFAKRGIFFHLWRDNLAAQAVSLYRAVSTTRFHSDTVGQVRALPPYDADQILHWLRHVAATENDNAAWLGKHDIAARHLTYEGITAGRVATVRQFAHVLGVPFTPDDFAMGGDKELTKIGDAWNADAEARFRRERGDELAAIEVARRVKHGIAGPRPHAAPAEPGLAQAWRDGLERGKLGRSPLMNPFSNQPAAFDAWHRGWCNGWNDQPHQA